MRSIAWAVSALFILTSTAKEVFWDPNARRANYAGYDFEALSRQDLVELREADLELQRCKAASINEWSYAPNDVAESIVAYETKTCQRAKEARVRDVAYKVEQRRRQTLREENPPRGGGGYTAEERIRKAEIFEEYRGCTAQADLMRRHEIEDMGRDWEMIPKFDKERKDDCVQRRDQQVQALEAGVKERHAATPEKRRVKTSQPEGWDLKVPRGKNLRNTIKAQAESVNKATSEFLQSGGIQAGLNNFMKNPISKGVTAPVGPKLGRVPLPLRV